MADYTQESEESLLRAARQYDQNRANVKMTPEQRAFADREYNAIGQEFQRRSPIEVSYEADIPAAPDPRSSRVLEPGDPGGPIPAPQGFLSGERFSPENKYGLSDLKADATKAAETLSPGLKLVNEKLRGDEAAARAEAPAVATQVPVPQGVDPRALREAEATIVGGAGPQVGVSTSQGRVSQTEKKILPPEWYQSLDRFTGHATDSAVRGTAGDLALLELHRQAAERRGQIDRDFRTATEESALREASAMSRARRKVDQAVKAYVASGPKYESVKTVLRDAPAGKQLMGGIGLILGIIGEAATGQPNQFTAAVNSNIERRARIAEAESRRLGDAIGVEGEQYRRLEQELGDARATRSLVRAIYLDEFKTELESRAAKVGIMAGDARLSKLFAEIEQARLGYLEKAAGVVMNQARSEQTVAPLKGEGGGVEEQLANYTEERRKRGMDTMEGGIRLMENGVQQMEGEGGRGYATTVAFRQMLANPRLWATLSAVVPGAKITPGEQAFINGFLQFLASDAGKALTDSERAGIASAAGRGDTAGLREMIRNFQTRYDAQERGLVPSYGKAIQLYRIRQQIDDAENPRKLYDVRGVETQPPVTERPPVR